MVIDQVGQGRTKMIVRPCKLRKHYFHLQWIYIFSWNLRKLILQRSNCNGRSICHNLETQVLFMGYLFHGYDKINILIYHYHLFNELIIILPNFSIFYHTGAVFNIVDPDSMQDTCHIWNSSPRVFNLYLGGHGFKSFTFRL